MIKPINSHILIEPVKQDDFIPTQSGQYQEIGTVIEIANDIPSIPIERGHKVLFDAWLAKKYPKEGTKDFYWLVRYEDVVAYEE